jgi:putative drug exporter of the RND superfamily
MLRRLGWFMVRRRRWVLAGTLVGVLLAGAFGGGVFDRLSGGGFSDPGAESSLATDDLEDVFGAGDPNVVLLVTATSGSVDDAAVAAAGTALTDELAGEPAIQQAFSYWSLGSPPPLRSDDASQALVLARIPGDEDAVDAAIEDLAPRYTRETPLLSVAAGGQAEVFRQVSTQVESDLQRAELITFPVVLILLVLVFGSVVAAGLPLAVAAISVVGTLLVLFVLTLVTDVSIFSINLTTALGIGLGIDYSLFIVSRFREELRGGLPSDDAVVRSVETAGRTVLFSGLTVAISLGALLVFPMYFLRSFAYAGIAVVALACLGALVFLPALLAALGPRVDRWTLIRRRQRAEGDGAWHRIATFVMRRPWPVVIVVVGVLGVLGAPFFGVEFGLPDDRVLPETASSRQVQDQIRANFSSREAAALSVVAVDAGPAGPARDEAVARYAAELSRLDGVARVDASTGSYLDGQLVAPPTPASARFAGEGGTWLAVVPAVEPISPEGEELVQDVRAAPAQFDTQVAGPSAELVDSRDSIVDRLPLALAIIAIVTFALLFLMTGSVLVPVKAIVLNLLSLSATFGAMVWVFQDGNLSGLLDFTATGTLTTSMLILMFCIAFGLSMDYEVFLLSRIKEEYDRTGDNQASVAMGLEKTGRIVTAAAALLSVVFVAFATSQITFIKMFGVGMALAVLMDATLIRAALVPAFMRLAGRANWWAPAPLRRLHDRIGLRESAEPVVLPVPALRPADPPSEGAA